MTSAGAVEALSPATEYITDSVLEDRARQRLEPLPEVADILEPLRLVHEATYLHCLRVGEVMAEAVEAVLPPHTSDSAYAAEVVADLVQTAFLCGALHDIGKREGSIPDLLDKPGRLTETERQTMDKHVPWGMAIVERAIQNACQSGNVRLRRQLEDASDAVRYHHSSYEELTCERTLGSLRWMPLVSHLADQIDARTTLDRVYQQSSDRRPNPGVMYTRDTQIIQPDVLLGAVHEEGRYGAEAQIFAIPLTTITKKLYELRFGTDGAVQRPLATLK